MKKIYLSLCLVLVMFLMVSCGDKTTNYRVTTEDVQIEVGEAITIDYTVTPSGTLDAPTLTLVSETAAGTVQISGKKVTGLAAGVATIELKVTNLAGASVTFEATTTFTVTVIEPIVPETDNVILNGSFENSFDNWVLTPADDTYTYKTDVSGDVAHDGVAAFNLWYNPAGEGTGYPVDLTATQTVTMKEDKYLLSFWFKGNVTTITASLIQDGDVVKEQVFSGNDYVAADVDGYVNYGFEIDATAGEYIVQFAIIGGTGSWGYIDLVTLQPGSEADIVVPNTTPEVGEYNFLTSTAVVEAKNGTESSMVSGQNINVWAADAVDYVAEYTLTNLPELVYNYCIYVNGTDLGIDVCKIYIKVSDTITQELDVMPIGWNNGIYERFEISNITLSGDVTIGIQVTEADAGDNWVNFTNITLYSVGYEKPLSNDTSITSLKVCDVEASGNSVTLTQALYENLESATDYSTVVVPTVAAGATVEAISFDSTSKVLSVTVKAEDGTSNTHEITVTISSEKIWQNVALVNPDFDLADVWTAEGWTVVGTTNEWIISGTEGVDGTGCINLWDKLTVGTPATITQSVAGFTEGETVKLGFYLNSGNDNATISAIIGSHTEVITFTTEWAYTYIEVEYTLTAADIVEGSVTIGVQLDALKEGATVKLDAFTLKVYR